MDLDASYYHLQPDGNHGKTPFDSQYCVKMGCKEPGEKERKYIAGITVGPHVFRMIVCSEVPISASLKDRDCNLSGTPGYSMNTSSTRNDPDVGN